MAAPSTGNSTASFSRQRSVSSLLLRPGCGAARPRAAGHETTHARILQFCSRVYGPLFTAGLHYWQLGESHYWGHNAIIRTSAFASHAGLPDLPGRGPLGGHILSHDFVEAALIRRGGWEVRMDTDLGGSWEGSPQTLLDLAGYPKAAGAAQ